MQNFRTFHTIRICLKSKIYIQKQVVFFRESLERVTRNEEFYENEMKRRLVEISTQTRRNEGSGEGVEKPAFEVIS